MNEQVKKKKKQIIFDVSRESLITLYICKKKKECEGNGEKKCLDKASR